MSEKIYKRFLEFLQWLNFIIIDAIDEERLRRNDVEKIVSALKEIVTAVEDTEVDKEKLIGAIMALYEVGKFYNIFLEEDEKDFSNKFFKEGREGEVSRLIKEAVDLVEYEKVKNTLIAFAEDLINEIMLMEEKD
ncbi:MAG: hypothetical protein ACP6IP_04455 [Candidatus Njordarchaeia archaeon]